MAFRYLTAAADAKKAWDTKHPPKKAKSVQKKPVSGYTLFVKQNFQSFAKPGASGPDTVRLLAGAWKKLTVSEKEKYNAS